MADKPKEQVETAPDPDEDDLDDLDGKPPNYNAFDFRITHTSQMSLTNSPPNRKMRPNPHPQAQNPQQLLGQANRKMPRLQACQTTTSSPHNCKQACRA